MSQYNITFEVFAANPRNVNEFKKDYYKRIGDVVGKSALTIKDYYTLYVSRLMNTAKMQGLQPKT